MTRIPWECAAFTRNGGILLGPVAGQKRLQEPKGVLGLYVRGAPAFDLEVLSECLKSFIFTFWPIARKTLKINTRNIIFNVIRSSEGNTAKETFLLCRQPWSKAVSSRLKIPRLEFLFWPFLWGSGLSTPQFSPQDYLG